MSKIRLFKDLKKNVQIDYKKNDKGGHINRSYQFENDYLLNLCNRSGSLVCPPANQHVLA